MDGGVSKVHYDTLLRAGHRPVRYCSVRVFAQDGIEIAVDYRSQNNYCATDACKTNVEL